MQKLQPLELSCDKERERGNNALDPKATESRPKRKAAKDVEQVIKEVSVDEKRGIADH